MEKQGVCYGNGMCVSDLDGTLLDGLKNVSSRDIDTLVYLGEKRVVRVVATGRSLFSVNKVLPDNFPIDFLIFSTGAGILDWRSKEIIHKNQFTPNEVRKLISQFLSFNLDFMIHEPIPLNHHFFYHHSGNHVGTDFLERIALYNQYCSPFIPGVDFPDGATQLIAILPEDINLFTKINAKLADLKVIRTTSPLDGKSIWMEIFPNNVSKAHGIEWLCKKLGINHKKKVMVLGNDYNDLDMLNISTNSFVVFNAPNELKKNYRVVRSNNDSGFSDAVSIWLTADSI